jgi:hypothetical protein
MTMELPLPQSEGERTGETQHASMLKKKEHQANKRTPSTENFQREFAELRKQLGTTLSGSQTLLFKFQNPSICI